MMLSQSGVLNETELGPDSRVKSGKTMEPRITSSSQAHLYYGRQHQISRVQTSNNAYNKNLRSRAINNSGLISSQKSIDQIRPRTNHTNNF